MAVSVAPQTFNYVEFDAALIARITQDLATAVGLGEYDIRVTVDETTPLARLFVDVGETIDIHADSGAFEDQRKPRSQSETATALALGRVLLRAYDRLHGGFGEAPADADLNLQQVAAWETYCVGRLSRLGLAPNQQRWRYNFRNRLGFSDAADAAFDQIWASDGLTFAGLEAICSDAKASA